MKVTLILPLSIFALSTTFAFASNVTIESESVGDLKARTLVARQHAKALGGALKARLQEAIGQGGLVKGIEACKLEAGPIAKAISGNGWTVGRTALRVRTPANTPDAWEREQLIAFSNQLSAQFDGPLEASHYDSATGEFRYLKAIKTDEICTACHGQSVAPRVQAAIDDAYPEDEAMGFDIGTLRGAFTLTYTP